MTAPLAEFDPALDLKLEREVDVPVELVWKAWTTPEHLHHWFIPKPWTLASVEIDLRPGGAFNMVMRSPEGQEFPNRGCYLEVGSIAPGNIFSYDATALVRGNSRLVATSNYSPWALEQSLAFLRRNLTRFPFERLISHVFPLERISEGFQQADWMQRQGAPHEKISRAAIAM